MYKAHDVPGRLRVKLEKLKNNPHRLTQVRQMLLVDGVYRVKTSALTGSVVIEYDPLTTDSNALIDLMIENGYPIANTPHDKQKRTAETHEKIALTVSKAAFSWMAGRVLDANGLSYIAAFI